ncbi:MAG: glycosyltransferase [Acidimicrobiales bacterium]
MIDVSVVVPVGPSIDHLDEQLLALANQETDRSYEVIVVDNVPAGRQFELPDERFRVVHAPERQTAGYARNVGASHALADVILFCDADDLVSNRWVEAMFRAGIDLDVFGGPIDERSLDPLPATETTERRLHLPTDFPLMPRFSGGNIGLRAEAFATLGGWDDAYRAAEDVDVSWRAQLAGLKVAFAPDALVYVRRRATARDAFSQGLGWGFAQPRLLRRYQHHGLRRPPLSDAVIDWMKLLMYVPAAAASRRLRRNWAALLGVRLGRVMGSLRWQRLLL